jgi:hypothetical protein
MEPAWRATVLRMTVFLAVALPMMGCGRSPLGTWAGESTSASPGRSVRHDAGSCGDARCVDSELCVTFEFAGTPSVPSCEPREGCNLGSQSCTSVMCDPPSGATRCLIQTNGKGTPTQCTCE